MKLLKTVLLSTSLLISVPFAADIADAAADDVASPARATAVAETARKFNAYQSNTAKTLYRVLTRDAGKYIPKGVVVSDKSTDVEMMIAISATLKAFTANLESLTADETAMQATIDEKQAANQQLTADKARLEVELEKATAKLTAVTAEKADVDGQLTAASAKVAELEAQLAAEKAAAETAGAEAARTIAGLTADLAAAQREVAALTEQADELAAIQAKAARDKATFEAGARALQEQLAGAAAAGNDEHNPLADLNFEDDGEFDGGSPQSLFGSDGSPEGTPPAARRSLEAPMTAAATAADDEPKAGAGDTTAAPALDAATAAQIAELKSELAAAKDATTATPHKGTGSKKKNEAAQAAARTEVTRLTAALAALGVN